VQAETPVRRERPARHRARHRLTGRDQGGSWIRPARHMRS
jgi:hypothetical protein